MHTPLPSARVESARLVLSPLTFSDVTALTQVFASAETARMTHDIPHPFELDDAFAFLSMAMTQHSRRFPKWGIRLGGRLIGVLLFSETVGQDSFGPMLSLFIAHPYQNHGYGTEAVTAALGWLRTYGGARIVHAAHFADNAPSAQVLIRSGFLYTGRRTQETSLMRDSGHTALHLIKIL
ncbi:GNAT family N-acetyltransferase [Asticcacaulis machinosus]|uniref:GNAT family N-acetyltransferase n=1 Tax=Asticcacaulis machinosus TaxID=2984211 RepID=A0ABT5HL22_9CAUL|nr:GNAT family N-acetyltransferase [Asticcacaulis machinosus]MDC7676942.1 GNAT family N-acetyltransferase [Asticcacaulis machinosus]